MVIATGFFDGVHLGHKYVIEQLIKIAKLREEQSKIVTFWPHPRNVLQDEARSLRLLTTLDEKMSLLKNMGVDSVECIEFTRDFSTLSTQEYLKDYIISKYGGKAVLLGYDNRLGANSGSPVEIKPIAERLGLDVYIADEFNFAGENISSTKIRKQIEGGRVEKAQLMLGYPYTLHGVIISGNRLGRTIGFPTANMQVYEPLKILPARGVYLVRVHTVGKIRFGMCYVGYRPTISSALVLTIETNIFDFNEDIYGLDMKIEFLNYIRGDEKFSDIQKLKEQIEKDKNECLRLANLK